MSQAYASQGGWRAEYQKPLFYNVWLVGDQKIGVALLIVVTIAVVLLVTHFVNSLWGGLFAFCVMLPTIWHVFVPVHFEINGDGIVRSLLGRRRFIAWEDIRCYRIRRSGILLLPQKDRFFLESFRGFYLPVPASLNTEILYRFRVFVDRFDD